MRPLVPVFLALAAPSIAQVAAEDFELANTHGWGVEFGTAAAQQSTGGNPSGRIELAITSAGSSLPAATLMPGAVNHPWGGDFRALRITSFSFDRQVESGASNFGTRPFLLLGNDAGTRTDFSDDTWVFVATGDNFQFGFSAWTTVSTTIPSASVPLPMGWGAAALPGSPLFGSSEDDMWAAVIMDVSYVAIAMDRPFNGGAWFGSHIISFDNFELEGGGIGANYCDPAVANTTGAPADLAGFGSTVAGDNNLTLTVTSLPTNTFGFFLTSQTQAFVANPGGSQGNLCLGGSVGRYVGAGQIKNSGANGAFSLILDLTQVPTPGGLTAAVAGETWNFQAWHRDLVGGVVTSNFTNGLSVMLQ